MRPTILGLFACVSILTVARAQEPAKPEDDRARAVRLFREHAELDALPLLEALHKAKPDDREIKEMLACSLVQLTAVVKEADQPPTLVRARTMFLELKRGGGLSDLGETLLEMIPPDGKLPPRESRKDVADAIKAGEEAFVRRDYAKARASYERAVALDPGYYRAIVFVGDTYFAEGKLDQACAWFARAARIDPDGCVADRYWGDALMKQGRPSAARERYLRAVVAAPYGRPPWMSLSQWARASRTPLSHPKILPPEPEEGQARKVRVEDGTVHLAVYDALHEAWKKELFRLNFPDEPAYRPSLAEEYDALHRLARAVAGGIKDGMIKAPDPALARLVKLDDEGLLEAHILLARANEGIAKDYQAYRAKNRERLLKYLREYVAPVQTP